MNPEYWGVSVCTIDGQRFSIGDTSIPFTLQSCSKPLTYAIALDRLGQEVVHQYVGQEPSGRNFNELVLDYSSECDRMCVCVRVSYPDRVDRARSNPIPQMHVSLSLSSLCREAAQSDDQRRRDSDLLVTENADQAGNGPGGEVRLHDGLFQTAGRQ